MTFFKHGRDQRLPLYQQVRDELLENISTGIWLPDTPIPTESELTKNYGVAIGTIRKAVDTLVNDGLLYRSQGRGTFVRRPDFNASLLRFFRQMSSDGRFVMPKSQLLSKTMKQPSKAAAQALNIDERSKAICLERLRYLEDRVVLTEEIWLPASLFSRLIALDLAEFGNLLYPFYEQECGQLIASAKETLTIQSANTRIAKALNIADNSPAAVIERVAYGYDKTPLEYRISHGAAETFCYQIEIA
ncbi:GntR family transcriptional regulator [Marinomonas sp. M1K-6]|uniref:GntR family transcriptional regulator n=1 Tax=Marinomonas profundi TaxID=2726122 RepID=A0A847RBS8_9GAMM|nr:GntR family transcriptional regulator [Marinomonas profundi]NLQ17670.1 GntR family transcriptional regulator [Marinomonas profundi]UDV02114.1 GntR family transcriptional regulator [Marinomonas profundi]